MLGRNRPLNDAPHPVLEWAKVGAGASRRLASRLVVNIEAMQDLPITESAGVLSWLRLLDYPW